jgi:hypothetical protein
LMGLWCSREWLIPVKRRSIETLFLHHEE